MYLRFLLEKKIDGQGQVFERALKIWGLDHDKGGAFWSLYREYSAADQAKKESIDRRRSVIPIAGIEDYFGEYSAAESDRVKLERTKSKHEAALVKRA